MTTFRLEMRSGQDMREVDADKWSEIEGWLVFYRQPAVGGFIREYWRVQRSDVISMETKT